MAEDVNTYVYHFPDSQGQDNPTDYHWPDFQQKAEHEILGSFRHDYLPQIEPFL